MMRTCLRAGPCPFASGVPDQAGAGSETTPAPDRAPGRPASVSSPTSAGRPVPEWLGSQSAMLGFWIDRLIAEGDPGDLVSMIHRHQAWIALMRQRLGSG